jgi:AAA family ATP:ADP antiporter
MTAVFDIRPGDRRAAWSAAAALFALHVGHALLETARDTLFLAQVPATALPWAGLGIAVASLLVGRFVAGRRLAGLLLVGAAASTGFYLLQGRAASIALYVWTSLFAAAALSRAWLLVAEVFSPAQAKRLYPLVGAGALLGSASGSAAAARLVGAAGPRPLLLASAAALAVAAAVVTTFLRAPSAPSDAPRAAAGLIQTQPYLRRLILLALAAAATVTVVDYLFKSAAAAHLHGAELGAFFATVYAVLPALALVVQLALAPLLVRRLGAVGTAGALPVALLPLGVAAALGGALAPIVLAKAVDGALRASTSRVASELLLTPLPAAVRARFKPLIDAVGTRGGQALAALAVLATVALGAPPAALALEAALLAGLWLVALVGLKRGFLDQFRAGLRDGPGLAVGRATVEPAAALALVEALSSEADDEVRAAIELLARSGRAALIPTALIYHATPEVVRAALEALSASGRDLTLASAPLVRHPDPEIRAHAYRFRDPEQALADPSPHVQAVALIAILRRTPGEPGAERAAFRLARQGSAEARRALARAIADGGGPFEKLLHALAASREPEVLVEVARAVRVVPSRVFLARLTELLADRELRREVRLALLALGGPALAYLEVALADAGAPPAVRRHIPRTISGFRSPAAAAILVRALATTEDGAVRFKILRGLGRMRADRPDLPLDEAAVRAHAAATLARALQVLSWRVAVAEAGPQPLLEALLAEKERYALERLFRIAAVLRPDADLDLLHDALRSADRRRRDAALELLGAALDAGVRDRVLALVDDLPDAQRLKRAGGAPIPFADAVAAMQRDHSPPLQALATHVYPEAA